MADVDELVVVARQRLETMIGRVDEDLGLVASLAQHTLDTEYFVPDGIPVAERREHLVDADHARSLVSGSPASTWLAGGRSRRRRASHPGSGAIVRAAAGDSFDSRSNISKYLRSITGHS